MLLPLNCSVTSQFFLSYIFVMCLWNLCSFSLWSPSGLTKISLNAWSKRERRGGEGKRGEEKTRREESVRKKILFLFCLVTPLILSQITYDSALLFLLLALSLKINQGWKLGIFLVFSEQTLGCGRDF